MAPRKARTSIKQNGKEPKEKNGSGFFEGNTQLAQILKTIYNHKTIKTYNLTLHHPSSFFFFDTAQTKIYNSKWET